MPKPKEDPQSQTPAAVAKRRSRARTQALEAFAADIDRALQHPGPGRVREEAIYAVRRRDAALRQAEAL